VTFGVRKPHPLTYTTTADRMGLSVSECLFVDDMQINLDGAEAVGMPGFFFDHTRVAASCARLVGYLGLSPGGSGPGCTVRSSI